MRFSTEIFSKYRDFINASFGIYYGDIKKELLRIKIDKCLIKSGVKGYDDFFGLLVSGDEKYLRLFTDEITVNKTGFFRENDHFEMLRDRLPVMCAGGNIAKNSEIRVWSAACSTGQEPYTIAAVLHDVLPPHINIKILATDISSRVLLAATAGRYSIDLKDEIPKRYFERYFTEDGDSITVNDNIKTLVRFRHFNLMDRFPFSGLFDIIFCRNVMIYFDLATQQNIVDKIYACMAQGGLFFLGQSESLLNKRHTFKTLKYSVYCKMGY